MLPVYCEHFGLAREPFNVTPDPSFLYLSASHKEALAQLIYGVRARRGFVVLTGEVGTGKTTLVQSFLEEINDGHMRCAYLFDQPGSPSELLRALCLDFLLISPQEKEKGVSDYLTLLNGFLLESYQHGDNVAVIIDEAQNLSDEVLERVRLLSNFETKQHKLLQILLIGQPELSDRLNQPGLRQLKQRVALRHHLSPLSSTECKEYIAMRLEISGAAALFSEGAIEAVHRYSGGIPRLVNILCDNGLLSAYALRKPNVEPAMIDEIARDLHLTALRGSPPAAGRSPVMKPREAFSRATQEDVIELHESTDAPPPQPHGKVVGIKPIARIAPAAESLTVVHPIEISIRQPENGSNIRGETPSSCVPSGFFEAMIQVLTEAMGPMASIVLRDQIAALGESKSAFPSARLTKLIDEISREITNDSMKIHFRQMISKEIDGIPGSDKDWRRA